MALKLLHLQCCCQLYRCSSLQVVKSAVLYGRIFYNFCTQHDGAAGGVCSVGMSIWCSCVDIRSLHFYSLSNESLPRTDNCSRKTGLSSHSCHHTTESCFTVHCCGYRFLANSRWTDYIITQASDMLLSYAI